MFRRHLISLAALAVASSLAPAAMAQGKDIKIAHIYSKTGPLEAYGKQTQTGLMMGLSYATGGTMEVAGRKIVVIEKDDQGKPDLGKNLLAAAYGDDKVDLAVGPTASPVALAMLPVAEEYKKILLVEPAVADSIDRLWARAAAAAPALGHGGTGFGTRSRWGSARAGSPAPMRRLPGFQQIRPAHDSRRPSRR